MPNTSGRIEIRVEGQWGTICSVDNNTNSASLLCKQMGYSTGFWKSPQVTSNGYCESYNGHDYCGASYTKIWFYGIKCSLQDQTLNKCNKLVATREKCSHTNDAIIECTNANLEEGSPTPPGSIKMGPYAAVDNRFIGRAQMYIDKKWGSISSVGVSTSSVLVLCKMMNFNGGGEQLSDPDEINRVKQMMGNKGQPTFSATNLNCNGDEEKVQDCSYKTGQGANYNDQLLITCKGEGDPDGTNQTALPPMQSPPPSLGKLGIPSLDVSCSTKGNIADFKGDIGSSYRVKCPPGCGSEPGTIWGTGIYSSDSNICLAGIHLGTIDDQYGGYMVYTKMHGNTSYIGSTNNNVKSTEYNSAMPVSFILTKDDCSFENMSKLSTGMLQSFVEEKVSTALIDLRQSKITKLRHFKIRTTNKIQYSSFISMDKGMPPASFQWHPKEASFQFGPGKSIHFNKKIGNFPSFTFTAKIKWDGKTRGDTYIFSYGDAYGIQFYIDEETRLVVDNSLPSEKSFVKSKFYIPQNKVIVIVVIYGEETITMSFYDMIKNTVKRESHKKQFQIREQNEIGVGRFSTFARGEFMGMIQFLAIYNSEMNPNDAAKLPGNMDKTKSIKKVDSITYTTDNRLCIEECTYAPTPGKQGSPNQPPESEGIPDEQGQDPKYGGPGPQKESGSQGGQRDSGSGDGQGGGSEPGGQGSHKAPEGSGRSDDGNGDGNGGDMNKSDYSKDPKSCPVQVPEPIFGGASPYNPEAGIVTIEGDCDKSLKDDYNFDGNVGEARRVDCSKCAKFTGKVFGSQVFHEKSNPCAAALHAGIFKDSDPKKMIKVKFQKGFKTYNGSEGTNGAPSFQFSEEFPSKVRSFTITPADDLKTLQCSTTLENDTFKNALPGSHFSVACPKGCDKNFSSDVYGSEVYSDNSSICKAAIHNGTLSPSGGEVAFIVQGSQSGFLGAECMSDQPSLDLGSRNRSFSFLGEKASITAKFEEDGKAAMETKWQVWKSSTAKDYEITHWIYDTKKIQERSTFNNNYVLIKHKGTIYSDEELMPATILFLKRINFINGKVTFMLQMRSPKKLYIIFRYVSPNSFYAIEIDQEKNYKNITFYLKSGDHTKTLGQTSFTFKLGQYYSWELTLIFSSIKIAVKPYEISRPITLFKVMDESIKRGSFAFGSNANQDFSIISFRIDPFIPHRKDNFEKDDYLLNLDDLLNNLSKVNRKKKCKEWEAKNQLTMAEKKTCCKIYTYCMIRCSEKVKDTQSLYWYSCYKQCFKRALLEKNKGNMKSQVWDPKKDDKCDFKPVVEKTYMPCVVERTFKSGEKDMIEVRYMDLEGNVSKAQAEKATGVVEKCGDKLTSRQDCNSKPDF